MGENWDRLQSLLKTHGVELRSGSSVDFGDVPEWIVLVKMYSSPSIDDVLFWLIKEFEQK
jgi:hypothetical protein